MRRVLLLIGLAMLVMACGDTGVTDLTPNDPARDIQDASTDNGGNAAFFWLAPIVKNPTHAGVFNPLLKPAVVICALGAADADGVKECIGEPIASYTMTTGTDGQTIGLSSTGQHYQVNWQTKNYLIDPNATYRMQVFLTPAPNSERLGFADVVFANNMAAAKNLATGDDIALVDGSTLPVRFRIEEGVSCNGESDCGEAVIGPDGGTVTTESGFAGVEVPEGATNEDVLITVRGVDPSTQPWGRCLPTGLHQEEGCYEFDAELASDGSSLEQFNALVTVGVCIDPDALRPDRLLLHKYDPDSPEQRVTALDATTENFLTCEDFAYEDAGILGRFARGAARLLAPVGRLVGGTPLYATDAGRAGLTDAFSFIGWAEPVTFSVAIAPALLTPESDVALVLGAVTAHNHGHTPLPASDHVLRLEYTDPGEVPLDTVLAPDTTNAAGQSDPAWTLTESVGIHTLTVSTRMKIELSSGDSVVVEDPTALLTVEVGGFASADDCADGDPDCTVEVVSTSGGTVITPSGHAGVSVPDGAVDEPIAIRIRRVDPDTMPDERCLPTGLRQVEGCYEYDTEPALDEVNSQDAFNVDVTVAICISDPLERDDYLTLHKYDPERPDSGVVELEGATSFLTDDDCADFAALPNGLFERLAATGRRLIAPVAGVVLPRPLYATDAGRAGLTDAFSFIGWAEPVSLDVITEPNALDPSITDVVVTATTAHNHDDSAQPLTPVDAEGHTIRFEYTDPSLAMTVHESVTEANGQARLTLGTQPGNHNVQVSTQQETLVDETFIVAGSGGPYGFFGAPTLQEGFRSLLIKDPTQVKHAPEVKVLGRVSLWSADGDGSALEDVLGPNDGREEQGVVTVVPGVVGSGLYFDGGVVSADAANFGDAAQWTIAAWVNLDPEGDPFAVQRFVTLAPTEKAVLRQESADETEARMLHAFAALDGDLKHVRVPQALIAGCWHHVVATYEGKYLRLYRDGALAGEVPLGGVESAAAESIVLGSADEPLQGTLDEVEIHNRALSEAEVAAAYDAVSAPACGLGAVGGQILDSTTGEPLVGAAVVVQGTSTGTVTDEIGRYLIRSAPAGSQVLEVSLVGFETETVSVNIEPGGSVTAEVSLVPLAALSAHQVTAGNWHSCALSDGQAFCWGNNASGQLGDGTSTDAVYPVATAQPEGVFFAGPITAWGDVSDGENDRAHTCARTSASPSAVLYCWGENDFGEVGDGSGTDRLTPVLVGDGLSGPVTAGSRHTCTSQPDFCWGLNGSGQLGNGTTTSSNAPVPFGAGDSNFARHISAGEQHTCATVISEERTVCWGANNFGQLGIGETGTPATEPVGVSGAPAYHELDAGEFHTCGIDVEGVMYCWGRNDAGQIGDGTTTATRAAPTRVADPASGPVVWARVTAGGLHTCGLTDAGEIYCWGANSTGQLGTGSQASSAIPAPVASTLSWGSVSAGGGHTCAVTTEQLVLCWGRNHKGQLGNGSTDPSLSPRPVIVPAS